MDRKMARPALFWFDAWSCNINLLTAYVGRASLVNIIGYFLWKIKRMIRERGKIHAGCPLRTLEDVKAAFKHDHTD